MGIFYFLLEELTLLSVIFLQYHDKGLDMEESTCKMLTFKVLSEISCP